MRMSYGRMFYNVGKIIKRKFPLLEEIKELLSCCGTEVLRRKVEQCTNIPNVLHLIQNECSLTDIELLHTVVKEMEITEATRYIEAYRLELKEFCNLLSIDLCLKERFASIPHLQCETVTFIFDWEPEEHVLKDIKDILSKVSGKLLIIKYIETSTSISVTCSFPFCDVGFTVLRMIENIHILMGQGLKKLTIGNLTLWRRQDVRLKELNQGLLQHTEAISYIILEEAEYKLRGAISSKEKEVVELQQVLEEEPLGKELTVLSSQFNEIQKENKELSDKLSKIKVEYLRSLSLSSNTDSAASKVRRGMSFEIDDCKFHLKAMTRPDYQPLVDNKRIIEKLQERITLMNMELITKREHNEKIIKDIKDHLKETEERRQREKKQKIEEENFGLRVRQTKIIVLFCNHPVTGELIHSFLKVDKDELLPIVLDKAYELMKLAPHIPIERCRLVKYDYFFNVMNQSFDLDEFQHQSIGQIMSMAGRYGLFLETRKENETFKKYNGQGINLKVSVIDLSTGEVGSAKPMRAELGWTIGELKQDIGEVFNINSSCMRLVSEEYNYLTSVTSVRDVSDVGGTLREIPYGGKRLLYVSSDPKDYKKEFEDSLMYRYVDFHCNWILLNITIPPGPKATPTTTNIPEGGTKMKIIFINEGNKEKERKIQVQVDERIILAQLKEELVPLIGAPSTGFIVYEIRDNNKEYEIERLDKTFKHMYIASGSELIVRLGRALRRGEKRIQLYLLQVNNTEFCNFMMESIVAKYTPVREFKKQIIEEAKVQEIDCVLELEKMRLRKKIGIIPYSVYLDDEVIDASMEMYVEPLKGPEKYEGQIHVYVIRWCPSQCSVDPIEEIILDNDDPKHVTGKLSQLSGVPVEYISFSLETSFPVEISCLDIENKLEWYSINSDSYLLLIYGDGCVIYYKDNRETMKELTDKERSEIQEAEEARLKRIRECKSQPRHRY
uniref:Ubiquitin carboxyl-terminal hydrolase 47 C-terminal domain-containing protein n=1 Tax=Amphimedon queenslandica TaxID=400682 RepID=A0A1X7TJ43_AMPQE